MKTNVSSNFITPPHTHTHNNGQVHMSPYGAVAEVGKSCLALIGRGTFYSSLNLLLAKPFSNVVTEKAKYYACIITVDPLFYDNC